MMDDPTKEELADLDPTMSRRSRQTYNVPTTVQESFQESRDQMMKRSVRKVLHASTACSESSDRYKYICVKSAPPIEEVPRTYDSSEGIEQYTCEMICENSIRHGLLEQLKDTLNDPNFIPVDFYSNPLPPEDLFSKLESANLSEKNLFFLWTVFNDRCNLLNAFLRIGADVKYYDNGGNSALHLSAFKGCLYCCRILIANGANVNGKTKSFSPLHCATFGNRADAAQLLIDNGASTTFTTTSASYEENILNCAVRANATDCLKLFLSKGVNINSTKFGGINPVHLAADTGKTRCLEILLDSRDVDVNTKTDINNNESSALHLASSKGHAECVVLLLSKGAEVDLKNNRGLTALHLAASTDALDCVEILLQNGKADPNAQDFNGRTPLHIAISKLENSVQILETLIRFGAKVNKRDEYGFTPLHLASLDGLSHCVETLIVHGANVVMKPKNGKTALNMMNRKIPNSKAIITRQMDSALTLHNSGEFSKQEVELEFDFSTFLQHSHPKEISYINTFVNEGQKEILLHPLLSAFLYLKWEKVRKLFVAKLILYFIFMLLYSVYVLTALVYCDGCKKNETDYRIDPDIKNNIGNHFSLTEALWWILMIFAVLELCQKCYGVAAYPTILKYFSQVENILEWFVILSVIMVFYGFPDLTHYSNEHNTYNWQNHIGAFGIIAGWTNLMYMIGHFPSFGVYVAMYQKVQKEFAKMFLAYLFILVGFLLGFCVIFSKEPQFEDPFIGFINVAMMAVGELNSDFLRDRENLFFYISTHLLFVLFLMFVTVVLMNLLVGIAVYDIEGLRKTADLAKLVHQTKHISQIELVLFNIYLPRFLLKLLHRSALVSPHSHRVILSVKPLNPAEKRLPVDIITKAYTIAKNNIDTAKLVDNPNTDIKISINDTASFQLRVCQSLDTIACDIKMLKGLIERPREYDRLFDYVKELKEIIENQQIQIQKLLDLKNSNTM